MYASGAYYCLGKVWGLVYEAEMDTQNKTLAHRVTKL